MSVVNWSYKIRFTSVLNRFFLVFYWYLRFELISSRNLFQTYGSSSLRFGREPNSNMFLYFILLFFVNKWSPWFVGSWAKEN
jgi:hypothetical protein